MTNLVTQASVSVVASAAAVGATVAAEEVVVAASAVASVGAWPAASVLPAATAQHCHLHPATSCTCSPWTTCWSRPFQLRQDLEEKNSIENNTSVANCIKCFTFVNYDSALVVT